MKKYLNKNEWTNYEVANEEKLNEYLTFLKENDLGIDAKKNYSNLHEHHIIPVGLDNSLENEDENKVCLTGINHLKAHIILASGVFELTSEIQWLMSSASCQLTSTWDIQDEITDELREAARQTRIGTKVPEYIRERMSGERETNGLKGKKWMYKIVNGEMFRYYANPEEVRDKLIDGYIIGFKFGKATTVRNKKEVVKERKVNNGSTGMKWMSKLIDGVVCKCLVTTDNIQSMLDDGYVFGMKAMV